MSAGDTARRSPQARLLAGARRRDVPASLAEHTAGYGRFPETDARGLAVMIDESGLLGRGGAAFPSSAKLSAVLGHRGRRVVVGNGVEGEPLSLKDKQLLRSVPHLVLDGLEVAATACGASDAILVVADNAPRELSAVEHALRERRKVGLDRIGVVLAAAPDRFVLGEETALVDWLSGRPGRPSLTPPRPSERGVNGRPTLVHNVETLANLALIARFGAGWFRALGTAAEPGSVLISVSGAVQRPGVVEIELGASIRDVVDGVGGATEHLGAYLVGGYFGSWLSTDAADVPLLDEHLAARGARLGARVLVALPARTCGLVETARVARWLANESAGQCGPCVHGLAAVATAFEKLAVGDARDLPKLHRWLREVQGRGACRHPDGAARFLASALEVFAREVELHAGGRCSGGGRAVLRTDVAA